MQNTDDSQHRAAIMRPRPHDEIAALRANEVDPPSRLCDSDQFTAILRYTGNWETCVHSNPPPDPDGFEELIASYGVDEEDFEPHCQDGETECDGCDQLQACPGGS